jgi:hypothetical protein
MADDETLAVINKVAEYREQLKDTSLSNEERRKLTTEMRKWQKAVWNTSLRQPLMEMRPGNTYETLAKLFGL